jgi:hypothetical protein
MLHSLAEQLGAGMPAQEVGGRTWRDCLRELLALHWEPNCIEFSSISICTYSSLQQQILESKPEESCCSFGLLDVALLRRNKQEQRSSEFGSAKQILLAQTLGDKARPSRLLLNVCACEKTNRN